MKSSSVSASLVMLLCKSCSRPLEWLLMLTMRSLSDSLLLLIIHDTYSHIMKALDVLLSADCDGRQLQ